MVGDFQRINVTESVLERWCLMVEDCFSDVSPVRFHFAEADWLDEGFYRKDDAIEVLSRLKEEYNHLGLVDHWKDISPELIARDSGMIFTFIDCELLLSVVPRYLILLAEQHQDRFLCDNSRLRNELNGAVSVFLMWLDKLYEDGKFIGFFDGHIDHDVFKELSYLVWANSSFTQKQWRDVSRIESLLVRLSREYVDDLGETKSVFASCMEDVKPPWLQEGESAE